jgi:transcriptional regulator with XRE-family HTH domain
LRTIFQNIFAVHTSQRISKFYEDLKRLDLRFPGKEIANKLKVSKGYVSDVLNKKKEPSEEFMTDFYKMFTSEFSNSSQSNEQSEHVLPIGALKVTLKDYVDLLIDKARKAEEREKEYLEIIKSKLLSIDASSKEIAEDISALTTEVQAEHRAMMDSIDVAAKQPIGTTRAAAHTVELAYEQERQDKGKKITGKPGKQD